MAGNSEIVIDNKRYNIATARLLGESTASDGKRTALFRKRSGALFLYEHGKGEPPCRKTIRDVTLDEAHAWMDEVLGTGAFDAAFSVDGAETQLNVAVSTACKIQIERAATARGCSQRRIIEDLVANHLR